MATLVTHPLAAIALARLIGPRPAPRRLALVASALSILPDADVLGFHLGVPYDGFWGHRGFTHSLCFAALAGVASARLFFPREELRRDGVRIVCVLVLAAASHGVLDAMTNGGLGIAFFSPLDDGRCFLPWRPLRVAPLELALHAGWLRVLASEVLWIWLPVGVVLAAFELVRARALGGRSPSA